MALFRRSKRNKKSSGSDDIESAEDAGEQDPSLDDVDESSPQRVGVVSGVLSTARADEGESSFADIVERRFGPDSSQSSGGSPGSGGEDRSSALPPRYEAEPVEATAEVVEPLEDSHLQEAPAKFEVILRQDHLRAVKPLFSEHPALPELEVDVMAHIGRATTISGNISAEEDLEIQGTIEGSVRLVDYQLTVGNDGNVKASVEANSVMVYGKITGNVVATESVEIEKGGIVGGDIKAPRIIMHDGAVVVGGLDMSAALPKGPGALEEDPAFDVTLDSPRLKSVEAPKDEILDAEEI